MLLGNRSQEAVENTDFHTILRVPTGIFYKFAVSRPMSSSLKKALSHVLDGPLRQAHGAIGLPNSDVPDTFMNIELHRALISHFQKQRLALVLALDVDALHDVESG